MLSIGDWLVNKENLIVVKYQVEPLVFILLEILTTPFYFWAWAKLIRGMRKKRKLDVKWLTILLVVILIPYLYVLIYGRNIPCFVYLLFIGLIVIVGIRNYFRIKKYIAHTD